uniref:Transmembrane protein n=1 Tax=Acrobeloides nanus TaxID=290746 RepID=A0A914DET9_9BILA
MSTLKSIFMVSIVLSLFEISNSINCYQNSGSFANPPKNNDKGSKKDCGDDVKYCLKVAQGRNAYRGCDGVGAVSLCSNSSCISCGYYSDCKICCCTGNDCNFAVGAKAFGLLILISTFVTFFIKF